MSFSCDRLCKAIEKLSDDDVNFVREEMDRRTSEIPMEQKNRNAELFMSILNNNTSKSKNKETALAEKFKKEYRNTGKTLNEVIAGMQDGSISDSVMLGIIKSTIGDLTWNE